MQKPCHHTPQSAIHPLEIMKDEWFLSRQSIQAGALIVDYSLQSPDEIEVSALTHHIIALQLNNGTRQVTRLDGHEYDGLNPKGAAWLAPAGIPAFWHWETTDEAISFILDPLFLAGIAEQTDCLNPSRVELLSVPIAYDPHIESIGLLFKSEMQHNAIGSRLYTESLANQLAIHLLRNYCAFEPKFRQYKGGLPEYKLRQAIDYINEHLAENLSLEAIASVLGISSYYFCRLFKQSMGITPYQYLITCRIEKAKQLLKQHSLPLIEVALSCGFANQSSFTQKFRQIVGTTPKNYRHG